MHTHTHMQRTRGRPRLSIASQIRAKTIQSVFLWHSVYVSNFTNNHQKKSRRFDSDFDFSFSFNFDLGLDFELSLTLKVVAVNSIQLWIAFTFVGPSNYHRNGRLKMQLQSLYSTHIAYTLQLQLHEAFSQSSRGYSPLFVDYACKLLLPNDKWVYLNLAVRQIS